MSSDSESVIEFGTPEAEDRPRRFTYLRELGSDRRLPVLVAGLGAVAAFASLISEWQTTTMQNVAFTDGEEAQAQTFPTDLMELGSIGGAYLGGLFLLVITVVLTLFGPAAGRPYARLAGLGAGGMLFALLLALVQMLGSESVLVSTFLNAQLGEEQAPDLGYGRGIWCALIAVTAGLAALWSSGRETSGDDEPRRRRMPAEPDDTVPDTPLELTITPAAPFARFPGDRDQPHQA